MWISSIGAQRTRRPGPRTRLALLALAVAAAFAAVTLSGGLSAERVRRWVDGYGVAGPVLFVVVSAALTCALVPGPLLAGASGLLFGTALGTPLSILAATLGACAAFGLARRGGREAVEQLAGRRLRRLQGWVAPRPGDERWPGRDFLAVLYARILPGVPYSLVNYVAGLAPIRARAFAAATALGVAPRAFAYTALGGSLGSLGSPEAIVALVVLVAMSLGGLVLARRSGLGRRDPAR